MNASFTTRNELSVGPTGQHPEQSATLQSTGPQSSAAANRRGSQTLVPLVRRGLKLLGGDGDVRHVWKASRSVTASPDEYPGPAQGTRRLAVKRHG